MKHDLIDLHRALQDGTRIRASAGASSFRSKVTGSACLFVLTYDILRFITLSA